jgi:hypothetical protein
MLASQTLIDSAGDARTYLEGLEAERATAVLARLDAQPEYMSDLLEEIDLCRVVYVGMAVTEIASLRRELSGPLLG